MISKMVNYWKRYLKQFLAIEGKTSAMLYYPMELSPQRCHRKIPYWEKKADSLTPHEIINLVNTIEGLYEKAD